MSFVEEHKRRAGRRRIAGCGCIAVAVAALVIFGVCVLVLTLGDCGPELPTCHAASNRLLLWIMWSLAVFGIVTAVGLAWWANRSPKDD